MAIRGKKNPFPEKMKPTTNVFTTPQKKDPQPSGLSKERSVAKAAMKADRKHLGGGMSAAKVAKYAK